MTARLPITIALAFSALSLLYPTDVSAERAGLAFGAGTVGCGLYLEDRTNHNVIAEHQYAQWAWGFMSSHNINATKPEVPYVEEATVLAYLDKFCRDNPLRFVADGVTSLIDAKGAEAPRKPDRKAK